MAFQLTMLVEGLPYKRRFRHAREEGLRVGYLHASDDGENGNAPTAQMRERTNAQGVAAGRKDGREDGTEREGGRGEGERETKCVCRCQVSEGDEGLSEN